MRPSRAHALAFSAVLLSFSLPALADGPSAMLFVYFGGAIFLVLQLWIVASEFIYLALLLRGPSKLKILWWTVLINMASALVGLIPTILFYFVNPRRTPSGGMGRFGDSLRRVEMDSPSGGDVAEAPGRTESQGTRGAAVRNSR